MKALTPARIAEEAIDMLLERVGDIPVTDDMTEDDAWEQAKWQAVSEISEGCDVLLPEESQRAVAATALLEACKTALAVLETDWEGDEPSITGNQLRKAIALAEGRMVTTEDPCCSCGGTGKQLSRLFQGKPPAITEAEQPGSWPKELPY